MFWPSWVHWPGWEIDLLLEYLGTTRQCITAVHLIPLTDGKYGYALTGERNISTDHTKQFYWKQISFRSKLTSYLSFIWCSCSTMSDKFDQVLDMPEYYLLPAVDCRTLISLPVLESHSHNLKTFPALTSAKNNYLDILQPIFYTQFYYLTA